MNKKLIFDFLEDLSNNNSKVWMDKNRDRYKQAKNIWLNEIALMLNRLAKYDERLRPVQPKDTITRINNNRKFHPDRPVYKDNFTFTPFGGISSASFHVSISPSYSFIGGGVYHPSPDDLQKIREAIDYDGSELLKITQEKKFAKIFGGLNDDPDKLKSAPKGFPKDHKHIELLRRKNFTAIVEITKDQVIADSFADYIEKMFLVLKPMMDYLNRAISFEE